MSGRWVIPSPLETAQALSQELKIHPALCGILLRRGMKSAAESHHFLNPSLDDLESPFKFTGMPKAVERIFQAIRNTEKILIYGDYDVDGVTASAILFPILKSLGADVEAHLPHRRNEGYGLNQGSLERLLNKNFGLVITVDNGITGIGPVRFLNQRGVDVIIVDHHLPKSELPDAYAILSAATDGAGDPNLAACGLAFKLGWALLGDYKKAEPYLDLVTVGTVADLAPVKGDNRILLRFGLTILRGTRRKGLCALIKAAGLTRERLTTRDIAFGIGPRINASGRMGSPEHAFKLLTTENELEAQNLAQVLEEGNRDRQRVELAAFEEAVECVETDPLKEEQKVLVLQSSNWHEGVLGIVASRLVDRYARPSIVIAVREGVGKGSGRSLPHFSIFESVNQCRDILMNFGGHAQACGLTLKEEHIPHFRRRLNEAASDAHLSAGFAERAVDAELPLSDLDAKFISDMERLAPFGPGNPKPIFVSRNLRLKTTPRRRGKDTLAAWVTDGTGKAICEMVGFRCYERWKESRPRERFDAVYAPALNTFNGIESIGLELQDWR
ncbi:MAG: single-stranded-DNA-specific exonuclease RecJ [Candidatus Omnitrophica bacterium]|nr:single-stranded-DNA-specific exonuclease RecJ [Candidatus Omnitrophota bacterium]